jgi:AcrR family transcriptional regulator
MTDTKERILDVAIEVLGRSPDAGMADVASAAGVVRRTVYGYFPSRSDLVLALTQRAVNEIAAVLAEAAATHKAADVAWVDFITRLWPLTHRYRVLIVLRRGEFGEDIHALLRPVETTLADLVERGQASGEFGRHLPADVLSQVAWFAVFAIADNELSHETLGVRAATMTSLLMLGVPEPRAEALAHGRA